jgi:tRNA-splicing endonuclease subunit Sen2
MAETTTVNTSLDGRDASKVSEAASLGSAPSAISAATPPTFSRPPLNKVYALPIPIRTFPLPTFYPNNPISLLHLAYAWLSQVFRPPPLEPSVHIGIWDPESRSVHIRDAASIRALWEQGFFGKGSLSRSEPNWLKRELARRGSPEGKTVSEARTELRREERRLVKWERAKAELEAIEKQRLAEAATHPPIPAPSKLDGDVEDQIGGLEEPLAVPGSAHGLVPEPSLIGAAVESVAETVVKTVAKIVPFAMTPQAVKRDRVQEVKPPVGPAELLALPNSLARPTHSFGGRPTERKPPVGPAELLSLPNSFADLALISGGGNTVPETGHGILDKQTPPTLPSLPKINGHAGIKTAGGQSKINGHANANGYAVKASAFALGKRPIDEVSTNGAQNGLGNGVVSPAPSFPASDSTLTAVSAQDTEETLSQPSKRRKSVRFSPTVESTTFELSDPPSPKRSAGASSKNSIPAPANGYAEAVSEVAVPCPAPQLLSESTPESPDASAALAEVENKEHFQLAPEEAFFLAFSLGALSVLDPVTGSPIPTENLLGLLRSHSYFPPRSLGSPSELGPDDPFLVNYAVYHHFRSLGWVPRHGIKFGVDWILYQRGPVFDHSEFGIMVMPAFSDPLWKDHDHDVPAKSWSWLMGVNRVLSHVLKSLVLVYVDIPPPAVFNEAMQRGGIAEALKKYTIREVLVRRFSVNRNR